MGICLSWNEITITALADSRPFKFAIVPGAARGVPTSTSSVNQSTIITMHLLLCLIAVTLSSVVTSSHLKEHLVTGLCDSSVKSLSGI